MEKGFQKTFQFENDSSPGRGADSMKSSKRAAGMGLSQSSVIFVICAKGLRHQRSCLGRPFLVQGRTSRDRLLLDLLATDRHYLP
jgi:hypothetical protein